MKKAVFEKKFNAKIYFTAIGFEPSFMSGLKVGQNHKKLKFSIDNVENCTISLHCIQLH